MSKVKLLEYMDKPVIVNARNSMGCDENWYNSYYAISHTFSREEIEAMSEAEVSNLIKLGDTIAEYLY
jgi:hypothetical protein